MTFPRRFFSLLGLVTCCVALLGCGGPASVARGTVTLDGKPVSEGSINFEPSDGKGGSVGTGIRDGRFEVPAENQLVPGKKKVVIRATLKTGKQVPVGPPAPPGTMTDELQQYPARGAKPEAQEVDVKAGPNDFTFDLTTKPPEKAK